jgi:hypothetical protein
VSAIRARFRRRYGAGPLHLTGHLAAFAVAAFALRQIFGGGNDVLQLLEWYLGFALLHDLVLVPLYSGLDRLARGVLARRPRRRRGLAAAARGRAVPALNHVRAPALISGLLLLIYAPLITRVGERTYFRYGGHPVEGYLRNWLLITAGLFVLSGLLYAVRAWRRRGA